MGQTITILGGGNMGGAMAQRWHAAGHAVQVIERNPVRAEALRAAGMAVSGSLTDASGDTLVIAIKPQQFPEMKDALKNFASTRRVVSVMAGVSLATLSEIAPQVIRVMPNLAASIGESMSICVAAPAVGEEARAQTTALMEAIGRVAWLADEGEMHAATALAGCGPGYLFAFMEAMEKAGVAQGLSPELTCTLVRQTMRGAALLADGATESPAQLAKNVASPGGVTQAALDIFAAGNLEKLVAEAIDEAVKKSNTLAASA
jgi:pyrroline-5-carboxylate reductase